MGGTHQNTWRNRYKSDMKLRRPKVLWQQNGVVPWLKKIEKIATEKSLLHFSAETFKQLNFEEMAETTIPAKVEKWWTRCFWMGLERPVEKHMGKFTKETDCCHFINVWMLQSSKYIRHAHCLRIFFEVEKKTRKHERIEKCEYHLPPCSLLPESYLKCHE